MPLRTTKFLMKYAKEHKFALAAFNVNDLQSMLAAVEAAEEEDAPIILALGAGVLQAGRGKIVADMATSLAEQSRIPMAVHLDHGPSFDWAMKAIRYGFSSVMIDHSTKPWEENVRLTKEVVAAAHAVGVSVEAEIGHVGQGTEQLTDDMRKKLLTTPEMAVQFVEETGVDSLAVAVGNLHGLYSFEPKIEYDRLDAIVKACPAYIVMHGGSSTPGLDKATALGVTKINIATDAQVAYRDAVKNLFETKPLNSLRGMHITAAGKEAMKGVMIDRIRTFNANGKASTIPAYED